MLAYKNYIPTQGYTDIINPGKMGITKLHFGMLHLAPKTTYFDHSEDTDVALIPLSGTSTLLVGHNGNKANGVLGERQDVFHGEMSLAFVPHHTTYELLAGEAGSEIAVCKAPSDSGAPAEILGPGEIAEARSSHLRIREFQAGEVLNKTQHVEAICIYKFFKEEGAAALWMESATAEIKHIVLHHNDVLAIPAGTRFILPDDCAQSNAIQSRGYALCIERTG